MSEYNELKISPEDFSELPRKSKDLIIYQNLISINTKVEHINKNANTQKTYNQLGFIWLFVLSVILGLKKYLPFL